MRYALAMAKGTTCAGAVGRVRPTDRTMGRDTHTTAAPEMVALGEPMLATGMQCATARVRAMLGGKVTGMGALTARVREPAMLGVMVMATGTPYVKVAAMAWPLGMEADAASLSGPVADTATPFVRGLVVVLRCAADAGPETQDGKALAQGTRCALAVAEETRGARGRAMAVLGASAKVQGTRSEMVAAPATRAGQDPEVVTRNVLARETAVPLRMLKVARQDQAPVSARRFPRVTGMTTPK
ncbi:MAG: hypothetical protein OXQ93_05605 [Gemmatimonadota bacterium]|nr:hypothetical protein [Gemmatimonadota bacterium]